MNNETKYVTYDYTITEIIDSMNKSIEKMKNIITSQTKLCEYLDKSEDKELFKEFIKNLEDANTNYEEQIKVLTYRLTCMNEVQKMTLSNAEDRLVSLLLEALGVVNKEAKSIQEREDNHETIKIVKN